MGTLVLDARGPFPTWPILWAVKVINMSLEGHLEKGLFCHCWLNVGKPGIELVGLLLPMFAKVCKILQLPTLEF